MGRKNRRVSNDVYDEQLLCEFESMAIKTEGTKRKDLTLLSISPLTDNQRKVFEEYENGNHLMLHGVPGSGKTFLAFYLALKDVMHKKYEKLLIVRSIVSSREMGFLPGTIEEKVEVFLLPYKDICAKLFGVSDAFERLVKRGMIEFVPTSHVRGLTWDNVVVIIDEVSNCNFHETDSVITRIGRECKLMMCGDYYQTDLRYKKNDTTGILEIIKICRSMKSFSCIDFTIDDIVRSDFVKEYIIAKLELGL